MAWQKLPLVTPCEQFLTDSCPMHEWFSMARRMEEDDAVIDVSLFAVQPWIDVPERSIPRPLYPLDRDMTWKAA